MDVTDGADSFAELLLPEHLLQALAAAGFTKPSPVQTTAIPLARVGADLVVQAKSGTGKTLVFGIPCVENASLAESLPQARCILATHTPHRMRSDLMRGGHASSLNRRCCTGGHTAQAGCAHTAVLCCGQACTKHVATCQHMLLSSAQVTQLRRASALALQALILTPTREIALQVAAVLRALAAEVPGLIIGTLIGGLPIEDDQKLLRRCIRISVRAWLT